MIQTLLQKWFRRQEEEVVVPIIEKPIWRLLDNIVNLVIRNEPWVRDGNVLQVNEWYRHDGRKLTFRFGNRMVLATLTDTQWEFQYTPYMQQSATSLSYPSATYVVENAHLQGHIRRLLLLMGDDFYGNRAEDWAQAEKEQRPPVEHVETTEPVSNTVV